MITIVYQFFCFPKYFTPSLVHNFFHHQLRHTLFIFFLGLIGSVNRLSSCSSVKYFYVSPYISGASVSRNLETVSFHRTFAASVMPTISRSTYVSLFEGGLFQFSLLSTQLLKPFRSSSHKLESSLSLHCLSVTCKKISYYSRTLPSYNSSLCIANLNC